MIAPRPAVESTPEDALRRALQRSEFVRVLLLGALIAVLVALTIIRSLGADDVAERTSFPVRLGILLVGGVYAACLALVVRWAQSRQLLLPGWFWGATVVAESFLPTIAILGLIRSRAMSPLDDTQAPAVLVYALLAIVSILRLRPSLSLLGGALAAAQHAALVVYAHSLSPSHTAPLSYFLAYSALILIAGACAAAVGAAIRRHVLASLREAATRAELGEVRQGLRVARDIQQRLLPEAPLQINGYSIAGRNQPADETGGDYYDWMTLDRGRAAVAIADVSGHGVGPALLMAICRAYARSSIPSIDQLEHAVSRLNALVAQDFKDGRFVTCAVAVINDRTGELDLLSAGHGPILLFRADSRKVETFDGDGLPLGIIPDEVFPTPRRLVLARGDILFMPTDGFLEAKNPSGEQFGTDRIIQALTRHAGAPLEDLLAAVEADTRRFMAGVPQLDDMTAVAIRREH